MSPLTKSMIFHLAGPVTLQLVLLVTLLKPLVAGVLAVLLVLTAFPLGFIAPAAMLFACALCAALHLIQTVRYAPSWESRKKQFLVGLLNPSLAILAMLGLMFLQMRGWQFSL